MGVTDRGAGGRTYDRPVVSPFMPDPEKVAAIRTLLPATGAGIYLNAGSAGPMPAETQLAMDELSARELAIGRASPEGFEEIQQRWAELRASIAAVLVADPDDVALTHSTTDGMNLAVNALPWREGDRVITTRHEHAGGLGPLLALRERLGIEVEPARHRRRRRRRAHGRGVPHRPGATRPRDRREPRPVDDRRRPAGRSDRGTRAGRRRGHDHRRRPVGGGHPDRHRVAGRGRVRDPRPEVAARTGGHGRAVGPTRLGRQRRARERRLHLVRDLRPRPAGPPPGRPPVRVRVLPSPVRRRPRPELWLADDVHRAAVGPRASRPAWPWRPRTGWRASTG